MLSKSVRCRQNRLRGDYAERLVMAELQHQGAICLQRIATPTAMRRGRRIFTSRVCGDIMGIWPSGRGILVEVKARTDKEGRWHRPCPSDLEPHQKDALIAWDKAGGSALVAWVSEQGVILEPVGNFLHMH